MRRRIAARASILVSIGGNDLSHSIRSVVPGEAAAESDGPRPPCGPPLSTFKEFFSLLRAIKSFGPHPNPRPLRPVPRGLRPASMARQTLLKWNVALEEASYGVAGALVVPTADVFDGRPGPPLARPLPSGRRAATPRSPRASSRRCASPPAPRGARDGPIREEAGVDIGATLAKAVVVPVGASLETLRVTSCAPRGDLPALAAFLASRPRLRLAATGAGAHRLGSLVQERRAARRSRTSSRPGARARRCSSRKADFTPDDAALPRQPRHGHVDPAHRAGRARRRARAARASAAARCAASASSCSGRSTTTPSRPSRSRATGAAWTSSCATSTRRARSRSRAISRPRTSAASRHATRATSRTRSRASSARTSRSSPRPSRSRRPSPFPLDIVYAGATLRQNVALRDVLAFATSVGGARARFLPNGEFVGAVGALARARKLAEGGPAVTTHVRPRGPRRPRDRRVPRDRRRDRPARSRPRTRASRCTTGVLARGRACRRGFDRRRRPARPLLVSADARGRRRAPPRDGRGREGLGAPEILVNNAGFYRPNPFEGPDDAAFLTRWRATMAVNLEAAAHFSFLALPAMRAEEVGAHRHDRVALGVPGRDGPSGLRRLEGRHGESRPLPRAQRGAARRHGELGLPRLGANRGGARSAGRAAGGARSSRRSRWGASPRRPTSRTPCSTSCRRSAGTRTESRFP